MGFKTAVAIIVVAVALVSCGKKEGGGENKTQTQNSGVVSGQVPGKAFSLKAGEARASLLNPGEVEVSLWDGNAAPCDSNIFAKYMQLDGFIYFTIKQAGENPLAGMNGSTMYSHLGYSKNEADNTTMVYLASSGRANVTRFDDQIEGYVEGMGTSGLNISGTFSVKKCP